MSSSKSLRHILKHFTNKRILVVGDLMLDRYIWGQVRRISPEAPIPVVESRREDAKAGGAANVAMNLAALGAKVSCAGFIGNDSAGKQLRLSLEDKGIDCQGIVSTRVRPTTTKTRVIAQHQQIVRIDNEDASPLPPSLITSIKKRLFPLLDHQDGIILSDYNKGLLSSGLAEAIISAGSKSHKLVTVDPKPQNVSHFRGATLITPNRAEAEGACKKTFRDEHELIDGGFTLQKDLDFQAVLITRGEEGMSLFENGAHTHFPTVAKRVFDVTGAGDTVIAAATISLCAGASFADAARIANVAASISVENVGAYAVSLKELAEALN